MEIDDLMYINIDEASILEEYILQPLNEYYIGKNKYMNELENLVTSARKVGIPAKNSGAKRINNSRELLDLDLFIERTFGFKTFNTRIIRVLPTEYSFSVLPVGSNLDLDNPKKYIHADKDRIYYDKKANYCAIMLITDSIFFNTLFTDAEIAALILQGIGRNFQNAISPICRGFSMVDDVLSIVSIPFLIIKNPVKDAYNRINPGNDVGQILKGVARTITKVASIPQIKNSLIGALRKRREENLESWSSGLKFIKLLVSLCGGIGYVFDKIGILNRSFNPIRQYTLSAIKGLDTAIDNVSGGKFFSGYRGEIISDSFATVFGYGAELASFTEKIDKDLQGNKLDKALSTTGPSLLKNYLDLMDLPNLVISTMTDPKPTDGVKFKKQVEYLEKELMNEDLSPRMKKEIQDQIRKIEILIDKCTVPKNAILDGRLFKKLFNAISIFLMKLPFSRSNILGNNVYDDFDAIYKACQEKD